MLVAKVPNNKNCSGDTKECGVGPTVNIDEIYIDAGFEQCNNSKLFIVECNNAQSNFSCNKNEYILYLST